MARNESMSCLEKREILNRPAVSTASLMDLGEKMERSGLLHDALSFYEKAGARDAIARLRGIAEQEGDLFLFRRTSRALGEEPTVEDWLAVALRARDLGKTAFAADAFRLAGREDLLPKPPSLTIDPS
jgi:hypothetical protein